MYSVVALFCEDVREEKAGTVSVIGIYTDNITVTSVPFNFAKFAIYTRLNFPLTGEPPRAIALRLVSADGKAMPLATFDNELIEKARRESEEKGAPNFGLIGTAILVPFPVRQAGRMNVIAKIDDKELICGTLNVQLAKS